MIITIVVSVPTNANLFQKTCTFTKEDSIDIDRAYRIYNMIERSYKRKDSIVSRKEDIE